MSKSRMASRVLYALGESPPLGVIPTHMHAATIRPERYGKALHAFDLEVVDVPPVGAQQALVQVMAAGVDYNGVWAAAGKPLDVIAQRRKRGCTDEFHIAGSEASGIVWAVGDRVTNVEVGDDVVLSAVRWERDAPDIRMGADPITSESVRVWGYEDNYGAFAQFSVVEDYQCFPKPPHLTWEEAACYLVSGAAAYRLLNGWPPNTVKPGDPVLIWGGAGGLGSLAIQIVRELGGIPIAVVSSDAKADHCRALGAKGVINRTEFDHWGPLPDQNDAEATARWTKGARAFGKKIWEVLGERRNPKIVFEHVGEATIPTSIFVCDNGGMVTICGATSGYIGDVDFRYLWMRQKRLQGSHLWSSEQCTALNQLVIEGRIDPCLSKVWDLIQIGEAHQIMAENTHPPGNMAILVNAPRAGLTDFPG